MGYSRLFSGGRLLTYLKDLRLLTLLARSRFFSLNDRENQPVLGASPGIVDIHFKELFISMKVTYILVEVIFT